MVGGLRKSCYYTKNPIVMKKSPWLIVCFIAVASWLPASASSYEELTKNFTFGKVAAQSLSVMTFGPEGILFIGDAKGGKVFALDLNDRVQNTTTEGFGMADVEGKLASLLGTDAKGVIIHDLAVNPISQNLYLTVSRSDANQLGFWKTPNDITNANILLRISPDGKITEVDLSNINHNKANIPSVIAEGKGTNYRKSDNRTDAITDIAYDDGKLYVTGLSNEEFASALRVLDFPFGKKSAYSTIEVYHVAHGTYETEAPMRTLLPYELNGKKYILGAYTCTPFVSIPIEDLTAKKHRKTKTLGEFGFGNIPVDIIRYKNKGKDYILMSNNSKALIRIDPNDIPSQEALTTPLKEGEYAVGIPHAVLSRVGITQIDNLNEKNVLVLQRMPNGQLNLRSYNTDWL